MITLKFILDTTKKRANIELLCSFVIGTNLRLITSNLKKI